MATGTFRKWASIVGMALVAATMAACGGSGSGGTTPSEAACQGSECRPDDEVAPECETDGECAAAASCFACADGQELCPVAECVDRRCVVAIPDCPLPPPPAGCGGLLGIPCADGLICVDDPNDDCGAGIAADCPGMCVRDSGGECRADADCPPLRAPCAVCADGSLSCPTSTCTEGRCQVEIGSCPDGKRCGGFEGAACAEGFVCVDVPDDGCDAESGGADCGGVCVPDDKPKGCGGFGGFPCPDGLDCIDDPNDDCDLTAGGADCPGVCVAPEPRKCESDSECPQLRIACSLCADGSAACPSSACREGHCEVSYPTCPSPGGCESDADCKPGSSCRHDPLADCSFDPSIPCPRSCIPDEGPRRCGGFAGDVCPSGYRCADDPSDECDPNSGGADCGGLCEPDAGTECRGDGDCAQILALCTVCPDGSDACPHSQCVAGRCELSIDRCPDVPFCGGIAGFECKDGYECLDNPQDNCDPASGGADCGGICVPREQAPPCRDDSECFHILAPCQLCADGTAACPSSSCVDGECRGEFPSCDAPVSAE